MPDPNEIASLTAGVDQTPPPDSGEGAGVTPPESPTDKDVKPPESSPGTDVPPDSSAGKGAPAPEKSAYEVAKESMAALKKKVEDSKKPAGSPPAAAAAAPAPEQKPTSDGKEPPAPNEAEAKAKAEADAKLPFAKHPRWQEVLTERNTAQESVRHRDEQISKLRPKAEATDKLHTFLATSGISPDGFQQGMSALRAFASDNPVDGIRDTAEIIAAAAMHDPVEAWKILEPIVAKIQAAAGEVLPQDLNDKVASGVLSEEDARELARARAKVASTETRERTRGEREERTREERAVDAEVERREKVVDAVASWEKQWRAKDPDAVKLSTLVAGALHAKVAGLKGQVSPEQIAKIANDVVAEVKASVRAMMPAKQPMNGFLPDGRPKPAVPGEAATSFDAAKNAMSALRDGSVTLPS